MHQITGNIHKAEIIGDSRINSKILKYAILIHLSHAMRHQVDQNMGRNKRSDEYC